MQRPFRFFLALLIVFALMVAVWIAIGHGGRRYHGRTESDWVASLAIQPGPKEMQEWQELGPDAVPMLVRALSEGASPFQKWYRNHWYDLPLRVRKWTGMPRNSLGIRRNAPVVLDALACDISPAAPSLGHALRDEDPQVRINAAICLNRLLPKLGATKADIVPDLVQAMQDSNNVVRENVTQCLGNCPDESLVVAPALVRDFNDSVEHNRYLAVMTLKQMTLPEAARQKIEPMLLGCLDNDDLFVCINVATMLSEAQADPAREVPAFIEMLGNYRPPAQRLAAMALARYGPRASAAVPALRHAFEVGEPRVRVAASNALAQIDPQTTISAAKP